MTLIKHYQCHAWLLFTYYKYKRLTARQKQYLFCYRVQNYEKKSEQPRKI